MRLRTSFIVWFVVPVTCLLALSNVFYYYTTKQMLMNNHHNEVESFSSNIKVYFEHSLRSVDYAEKLLAENLRLAAMLAQTKLPPRLEQVSNKKLTELSKELGVSDITLFQRMGDDIVALRSSNPVQRNISAKEFESFWFRALNQLLDREEVSVSEGYTLPHYWSGPLDVASSDPNTLHKFGYYHDGQSDYMIDPYYRQEDMEEYVTLVSYMDFIERLQKEKPFLIELTGFNAEHFGKGIYEVKQNNRLVIPYPKRQIFFGQYAMQSDDDVEMVRQAHREKKTISYQTTVQGRDVIKSFVPIETGLPLVVGLVSDYSYIQNELKRQSEPLFTVSFVSFLMLGAFVFVLIRRSKLAAAVISAEKIYLESMNSLFTAIRGLNHDVGNIVNAIHAHVQKKEYDELEKVTQALVKEVVEIQDVVVIQHPTLSAIVQFAVSSAIKQKVKLEHDIAVTSDLKLNGEKSLDLIRMATNLISNAFDETVKLPVEERLVQVAAWTSGRLLYFKVSNRGRPIGEEELPQLLSAGYSTKFRHEGLGLQVVKELVQKYKGQLWVEDFESAGATFMFKIQI
ncbi:sensor histidine kinase [Paenibacillus ehimensis]|uniref:sensor histidine kinase n=1 Tax=Paenibacillus ehimensis TaxID=79264 RepID=UPI002DBE8F2C|nr:sensor histidine kinase [Paenibacillus ehimensis]MEC0209490.1 sensor histidine kinase [Paenibacillus ehimensis]